MKTLKEKALQIKEVDEKLRELGISEYLVEMTEEQKEKAFDVLDIEEYECKHPKDESVTISLIGVFFENNFLGAKGFQNEKEMPIQSKEQYDKTKNQILTIKNQ